MVSLISIIGILLFFHNVQNQFPSFYMDRTNSIGFHYDCLYYKVYDTVFPLLPLDHSIKKWDQIIPYCFRPFSETEEINHRRTEGDISSRFTFEELRNKRVTIHDLFAWSAPIDLVERYDEYLANHSSEFETFNNCSPSWFGPSCRYTFNISLSFDIIVNQTFADKREHDLLNMTCYLHLPCDRGPAPACLDWREICDGKVDCLGNDIDEIGCFELETNECEENEFRCHNGMCIPEEFLKEGYFYPDCLDGTDEDHRILKSGVISLSYFDCGKELGYWCEETSIAKHFRVFVCGDGEISFESILPTNNSWGTEICLSSRDSITKKSLLSYIVDPNFSYDCWFLLYCSAFGNYERDCSTICEDETQMDCYINMTNICQTNFAIFPQRPILQSHVFLVYLTNKTFFFEKEEISLFPEYICYDQRKCPFLPATSLLNINGTTCRSTKELNLREYQDITRLFGTCLIVLEKTNTSSSSLFQCPGTTKYISKHRVLDGFLDCYNGADEINIDACSWNDKYRFRCSSEQKCLSSILVRNRVENCLGGEDEISNTETKLSFQRLCNGYQHLSPMLIAGLSETDETHCDYWPCNNIYTRCDEAWNCLNGIDELNCAPSTCPRDTYECVSPKPRKIICLPFHRVGDGIIDCLGSMDERAFCRSFNHSEFEFDSRFRCWKEDVCVSTMLGCSGDHICFRDEWIVCSEDIASVVDRLNADEKLRYPVYEYFMLEPPINKTSTSNSSANSSLVSKRFPSRRTETCNRGILIFVGSKLTQSCLCPPSYFGDRCQYQNQRVSLTVRFSRICAPDCQGIFGIIVTLRDEENVIHDYEQFTYLSTYQCDYKYFKYLLYRTRSKEMTKTYHVRIDAYNKMNLSYYASWILPIRFLFLPVNRVSAHLFIPAYAVSVVSNCSRYCGHGECFSYVNNPDQYLCRCHSNWSGVNCTIPHHCTCSSDSQCIGHTNNQSICLCTLGKFGLRCRLPSICQNDTCKNGGLCIPDDQRVSPSTFVCICRSGFSGTTCEDLVPEIHLSFDNMEIPRSLLVHFITIQIQADPLRTTIPTKIPFDSDTAIVRLSVPFHMIIVQISNNYFLVFINATYISVPRFAIQIEWKLQCSHIEHLFANKTIPTYPFLRRVKYYHLLCQNHSQLKCFHDNEDYMCLCNEDGYANCFPFDFNTTYTCKQRGECQNEARCLVDRSNCAQSIFCECTDCFYGSKCQFTTKGFGLSLDAILGYQIRPNLSVNRQLPIVKVSIALTVVMFVIGLINSIVSILTFRRKTPGESGCRQYLLTTSIVSLCITIIFPLKFVMLILAQMSLITDMLVLQIFCIAIDFLLRLGIILSDWINACVAIDRLLAVVMDVKFNVNKSKRAVRWVLIGILLGSICSILHDPIHREVIYDQDEDRRWCLVQYSSSIEIYNSAVNIIHFSVPFAINIFASIMIIFGVARKRSKSRQQKPYCEILNEQFQQHRHLITSSVILVILATPRLIISFISGCMKTARDPSLYLAGYFISFIPPSLTIIVFIVPSKLYMKELQNVFGR